MTALNDLMNRAGETAKASGWHEGIPDPTLTPQDHITWISSKLMLVVSEISEALEELRSGHGPDLVYATQVVPLGGVEVDKPEGFPVEIADAIIRLFDLYWTLKDQGWDMPDLEAVIGNKLDMNALRGHKHGGKAI